MGPGGLTAATVQPPLPGLLRVAPNPTAVTCFQGGNGGLYGTGILLKIPRGVINGVGEDLISREKRWDLLKIPRSDKNGGGEVREGWVENTARRHRRTRRVG